MTNEILVNNGTKFELLAKKGRYALLHRLCDNSYVVACGFNRREDLGVDECDWDQGYYHDFLEGAAACYERSIDDYYGKESATKDMFMESENLSSLCRLVEETQDCTSVPQLCRTVIRYLAIHPINKHSHWLSPVRFDSTVQDIQDRIDTYVKHREEVYNNDIEEGPVKGLDRWTYEALDSLEDDYNRWINDANSNDMVLDVQYALTLYMDNKHTHLLRRVLLCDSAKDAAEYLIQFINKRRIAMKMMEQEKEELQLEICDTEIEVSHEGQHQCECCGEWFDDDDMNEIEPDRWVCSRCDEHYIQCEDCNHYHHEDDCTWIERYEKWVCCDCRDNYRRCCECGDLVHEDYINYNNLGGDWYCEDCESEIFTVCEDCGCDLYRDDAYYTDNGSGPYCEDCFSRNDIIHDWHDDCLEFEPRRADDENTDTPLVAFELEVSGSRRYAQGLKDIMGDDVVLCRDSSIKGDDGFEIISQPMSRRYFYETFVPLFTKGLEYLDRCGFKGHDCGGMHVHIDAINKPLQLVKMVKILYGDMEARDLWLKITQRQEHELEHWSSMTNRKTSLKSFLNGEKKVTTDRYTALNYDYDRTATHELRIFNSSTRIDRVIKNMECVFSLLDYVAIDERNLHVDTFTWLEFVKNNKESYSTFFDFCIEQDLFDQEIVSLDQMREYGLIDTYGDDFYIEDISSDDIEIPQSIQEALDHLIEIGANEWEYFVEENAEQPEREAVPA